MAHYLQLKSREVAKQSKLEAPAAASQLRDEADLQSAVTVLLEHETQGLSHATTNSAETALRDYTKMRNIVQLKAATSLPSKYSTSSPIVLCKNISEFILGHHFLFTIFLTPLMFLNNL